MATFLDIGLIEKMNFLFPFLLVLILVYVGLTRMELFKEKKGIAAIIAFVLAIITLTSSLITKTINKMAPWFILLVVFGLLILIVYQALGIKEDKIKDVMTNEEYGPAFFWWIMALVVLIGLGSFFTVFAEEKGHLSLTCDEIGDEKECGLWSVMFHPKILGLVLIFIIAYFAVQKMTSTR